MNHTITLQIRGMHCTSCAMNIDGELEDLGVIRSRTHYSRSETVVEFADPMTITRIQKTIKALGYESSLKP